MKIGIVSGSVHCIPLLRFLRATGIEVSIFSDTKEPVFNDVRQFCRQLAIPLEESVTLYQWLASNKPELVFILGYRHLIDCNQLPQELNGKVFNIHFGRLPDFRGPIPVFWQLKNGVKDVALCIHKINDKFDAGPVVWLKELPNEPHFTYGFLEFLFSQVTIEGVTYIINQHQNQEVVQELKTDKTNFRYYKRPELKDVLINWGNTPATDIVNLINACNPWNKGAITFYNGNEVKIIDAEILPEKIKEGNVLPGTIINHRQCLHICCVDKSILSVTMLNINGVYLPSRFADRLGFTAGRLLN